MRATPGNADIYFSDEGEGNPVVFLHGLGGRSTNWAYQRRYFQRDYRVICPDLPGHGASSGHALSFQSFAGIIIALLDQLQLPRYSLVGLSTGARVALSVAAARPDAVTCLTAVNTFLNLTAQDRSKRISIYDLLLEDDHADSWATVLLREMNVQEGSVIGRGFRRAAAAGDPIHIRRIFGEMVGWNQNDELKNICCPVQIIRGSLDKFVPSYCTEDLASRLRTVQVDVLDGLGHLPYLEDPIRFNDSLQRFLRAHAGL